MAGKNRLAIDAMGGDHGPVVTVPAAVAFLAHHPESTVVLIGDKNKIVEQLPASLQETPRIHIEHASQPIAMEDGLSAAIRKSDSSIHKGLQLLADKQVDGLVSAGNTAALVVLSRRMLGTLPGIDRPAICTFLPSREGRVYLLDMGANTRCTAQQLHQFGVMATCAVQMHEGIAKPKVGLLNIGTEELKGTEEIRQAAELFEQDARVNYCGFVEGNNLFEGDVDIVVCDGFSGNVALKSIEGLSLMVASIIKQAFGSGLWPRFVGLLAVPVVRKVLGRINPEHYNGASLLGVKGVVVKSHGVASTKAFVNALEVAALESQRNLPDKLSAELALHH